MKKTLHHFRARWLLLAAMLLGVLGVHAQDTWYLFDSYIGDGQARATFTNPDADGNYVAEITTAGARGSMFAFVNSPNPNSDSETARFLGSASGTVTVNGPATYDLKEINFDTFYADRNVFDISGQWIVTLNPTTMKVTFDVKAPDKLYICDWQQSFAEAENDGNGVYTFKNFVVTDSSYPHYGFTDTPSPTGASIVLGTVPYSEATTANNLEVTSAGASGTWEFSDYECINREIGSFGIPAGVAFDCVLNWNDKTVVFSKPEAPALPDDIPSTLYLVDYDKSYASAKNDGNGVFVFEAVSVPYNRYPYYGFSNTSNPRNASLILASASAAEATSANNVNVELDEEYSVYVSNWNAIDDCIGSYVIVEGSYDITLDWNAKTVKFTKPVIKAPDVLYIIDYQTSFGSAINNGEGIYEFEDVELTSGFPYYGFAPTDNPNTAAWAIGTADYATASAAGRHAYNIDVVFGEEYAFEFTDPHAMYDEIASFVLGTTPVNITLDWNKGTVVFYVKPLEAPAALYATDTYLEDLLGSCTNNGDGTFNMVVNVTKSSSLVVFTSSTDFKNAEGETLYYGTENRINNVEFEKEYGLAATDYNTVWGDQTGITLPQGRYKLDLSFPAATIVVHDISRGDVWTIPASLSMYDDEMGLVANGDKTEEGVFQFDNVAIAKTTNVVFTDNPTKSGKFFGSSMNGDRSIDVKNYRTYDLYIPTYQEILIDGLAGFQIPAGTWSIKVDMNEKNVSFVDPEAVYFPEQLEAMANAQPTSNLAQANPTYIWKLTLAQESDVTFSDPLTGRTYGSPEAGVAVTAGTEYAVAELAAGALNAYKVPAGTWEVVLDLESGKIIFYEYQAITLVDSTHKDGDKFYSYFGAGTEPMVTLTFSGNPYTVADAFLALGDYTPGMTKDTETCKIEKISVYRSGNTLFASFGGKSRSIPEGAQPKVTFVITTIKSVHGLLVDTDAISGLPAGSLMFTYDFEEFQPITIESKLQGAADDKALNVDEMETITLLVKPYSLITFDGVNLTAAAVEEDEDAAPATVALDWEAGEEDADGFTPIIVNVPMAIRGSGMWTLTLANLNADDNTQAHGDEVNYAIETLVHPADVVKADPESGSKVDALQDITLAWTHSLVTSAGYKGAQEPEVTVTDEDGATYPATLMVLSTLDANELLIHLESAIIKEGKYTVVVPAGTIVLNDDMETNAKAIELEYEVTGLGSISSILADPDAEVTVCTISGILLRQGRAADVLGNLREGIYIINGVKTRIR